MQNLTRRSFAKISTTVVASALGLVLSVIDLRADAAKEENQTAATPPDARSVSRPVEGNKLQSEFLLDLVFDKGPSNDIGVNRFVVPILAGTFDGPKLKGTVVNVSTTSGEVHLVHDHHVEGLFARASWLQWFRDVGLQATVSVDPWGRDVFVARPG